MNKWKKKETIKIQDLEKRIRDGEDLEFDDYLIELPDGQGVGTNKRKKRYWEK